jgi:hypothetical protein
MVYAIAGFSYLMASIASVLVGNDARKEPKPQQEKVAVTVQLSPRSRWRHCGYC